MHLTDTEVREANETLQLLMTLIHELCLHIVNTHDHDYPPPECLGLAVEVLKNFNGHTEATKAIKKAMGT